MCLSMSFVCKSPFLSLTVESCIVSSLPFALCIPYRGVLHHALPFAMRRVFPAPSRFFVFYHLEFVVFSVRKQRSVRGVLFLNCCFLCVFLRLCPPVVPFHRCPSVRLACHLITGEESIITFCRLSIVCPCLFTVCASMSQAVCVPLSCSCP